MSEQLCEYCNLRKEQYMRSRIKDADEFRYETICNDCIKKHGALRNSFTKFCRYVIKEHSIEDIGVFDVLCSEWRKGSGMNELDWEKSDFNKIKKECWASRDFIKEGR